MRASAAASNRPLLRVLSYPPNADPIARWPSTLAPLVKASSPPLPADRGSEAAGGRSVAPSPWALAIRAPAETTSREDRARNVGANRKDMDDLVSWGKARLGQTKHCDN